MTIKDTVPNLAISGIFYKRRTFRFDKEKKKFKFSHFFKKKNKLMNCAYIVQMDVKL